MNDACDFMIIMILLWLLCFTWIFLRNYFC